MEALSFPVELKKIKKIFFYCQDFGPTSIPASLIFPPPRAGRWETLGTRLHSPDQSVINHLFTWLPMICLLKNLFFLIFFFNFLIQQQHYKKIQYTTLLTLLTLLTVHCYNLLITTPLPSPGRRKIFHWHLGEGWDEKEDLQHTSHNSVTWQRTGYWNPNNIILQLVEKYKSLSQSYLVTAVIW